MARNEEKQLARLNRWYLQKQKEDEAIKRPPRPKLNSLGTAEEVKKWIPSITRDIDFYVKQMEVPCYPEHVITEFNRRIDHLKGEYKAFLRKLRDLCPENKSTPWTDRPYSPKQRKTAVDQQSVEEQCGAKGCDDSTRKKSKDIFIPLKTPVLDNTVEYKRFYGSLMPTATSSQDDLSDEHQNQPLYFLPISKTSERSNNTQSVIESSVSRNNESSVINYNENINSTFTDTQFPIESSVSKTNESSVINYYENNNCTLTDKSKVAQDFSETQNSVISSTSLATVKDSSCSNMEEKNNGIDSNNTLVNVNSIFKSTAPPIIPSLNLPYTDSSSDESDEAT